MTPALRELLVDTEQGMARGRSGLTAAQKRIVLALAAVLLLCGLATCGAAAFAVRNVVNRPIPAVLIVVTATPGPTAEPTAAPTAAPTATPTAAPTATSTATATPTARPAATVTRAPVVARAARVITVRGGPALDAPLIELARTGRVYRVTGRNETGDWLQVCCTREGQSGWVTAGSVQVEGSTSDLPIVTGIAPGNEGD
jgi:hypothetical protein